MESKQQTAKLHHPLLAGRKKTGDKQRSLQDSWLTNTNTNAQQQTGPSAMRCLHHTVRCLTRGEQGARNARRTSSLKQLHFDRQKFAATLGDHLARQGVKN